MSARERGYNPFTADVPGMNVSFSQSEESLAPSQGRAVDHLGFEIDGLEDFTKRLAEQGVSFDVEYQVVAQIGVAIAYFTDPSGTRWELTEGLDDLASRHPGNKD